MVEKLKELRELSLRKWALERSLLDEAADYAQTHRIFENGEIVEVFDECERYVCDGVVGGVTTSLFLDDLAVKDYAEGKRDPDTDKNKLRYEVFAVTKNNVASKKHIYQNQHFFYNIKDVKPNSLNRYIKAKK
jgi:hypothetical protein